MNKPKKFFITVAITMIMLFVLGNWATSAQATGVTILGATPTPTVMPAEPPDTPLGETPSAKEQEELKAFVQSYVDIRYRALSVSEAENFKENGIGSMMSEAPEAEVFQSEEMAKLAVEIKRADLNQLRYVDYKYSLDFRNITIDLLTQTATISVRGETLIKAIHRAVEGENLITEAQKKRVKHWRESKSDKREKLTEREKEILSLLGRGLNNTPISKELGISYHTTAFHITNILKKLEVGSRQKAIIWANENLEDSLQTG